LGIAITSILLLGIPLAYVVNRLIYEDAKENLNLKAASLLKELQFPLSNGKKIDTDEIAKAYPDLRIVIRLPNDRTETVGPDLEQPLMTQEYNGDNMTVRLSQRIQDVRDEALRQMLLIGALILLGVAVAV